MDDAGLHPRRQNSTQKSVPNAPTNYFMENILGDLRHSLWIEKNKRLIFSETFVKVPAF
jgi:hypothetical protein